MAEQSAGKNRKKRRKPPVRIQYILIVAFILCAGFFIGIFSSFREKGKYEKMSREMDIQIQQEQSQGEKLRREVEEIGTPEYIEQQAREKLGLVFENEIILRKD